MTNLQQLLEGGQDGWVALYVKLLGYPLSDRERFFRALDAYGSWILYDAITISSVRSPDGDPLGYVLAVAHSKWADQVKAELDKERYSIRINAAKENSKLRNEELAEKVEKKKRKIREVGGSNEYSPI